MRRWRRAWKWRAAHGPWLLSDISHRYVQRRWSVLKNEDD